MKTQVSCISLATCSEAVACAATPPGKTHKISTKNVLQESEITCDYKKTKLMFRKNHSSGTNKISQPDGQESSFYKLWNPSGTPKSNSTQGDPSEGLVQAEDAHRLVPRGSPWRCHPSPWCTVSLPVKGIDTETGGEKKYKKSS